MNYIMSLFIHSVIQISIYHIRLYVYEFGKTQPIANEI